MLLSILPLLLGISEVWDKQIPVRPGVIICITKELDLPFLHFRPLLSLICGIFFFEHFILLKKYERIFLKNIGRSLELLLGP